MHIFAGSSRNNSIPRDALRLAITTSRVRGLHLDTEALSFPKARESAVMTVRAACGVRPVGPIPRPRSCDVHVQADAPDDESADGRDDAHPIRNVLTISRSR